MTRGADVLFFAFCLKAAGVQNDRDEIVVRSVVSVAGTSRRLVEKFPITPARNDPDPIESDQDPISLWMISRQALRACPERKPVPALRKRDPAGRIMLSLGRGARIVLVEGWAHPGWMQCCGTAPLSNAADQARLTEA